MYAKLLYYFGVFFHILILGHKGSANYLNTLFGTKTSDDDTVLYVTTALTILCVIMAICLIVCLCWLYRVVERRVKERRERLALEARSRQWHGDINDVIDSAQTILPMPRASIKRGQEQGYDNYGAKTLEAEDKQKSRYDNESPRKTKKYAHKYKDDLSEEFAYDQPSRGPRPNPGYIYSNNRGK